MTHPNMKFYRFVIIIFILLILNIFSAGGVPQFPYTIYGYINESNGLGVDGARIKITDLNTSESIVIYSISNGEYMLDDLATLPHGYSLGDYIQIDAEKDTRTGHGYLMLNRTTITEQEYDIYLTPFKLIVEANPRTIKADGTSKTNITVTLADYYDNPIKTEKVTSINLTTDLGNITEQIVIPVGSSSGTAVLQSSRKSGIATINITAKGLLGDNIKVGFVGEGTPYKVAIQTNTKSLPADGKTPAKIIVYLMSQTDVLVQSEKDRSFLVVTTLGDMSKSIIIIRAGQPISEDYILITSTKSGNATIKASSEKLEVGTETIIFTSLNYTYILAFIGSFVGTLISQFSLKGSKYSYEKKKLFPRISGNKLHMGRIFDIFLRSIIGVIFFILFNFFSPLPQENIIILVFGFWGGYFGPKGLEMIPGLKGQDKS